MHITYKMRNTDFVYNHRFIWFVAYVSDKNLLLHLNNVILSFSKASGQTQFKVYSCTTSTNKNEFENYFLGWSASRKIPPKSIHDLHSALA